MGIKILHISPITSRKICQKSMTSRNYIKVCFLDLFRWLTNINGNIPSKWLDIKPSNINGVLFVKKLIIFFNHIMCEYTIFIPLIFQIRLLEWYHTYLLHTGLDRTEEIIFQHFYWPRIRNFIWREFSNCDNFYS